MPIDDKQLREVKVGDILSHFELALETHLDTFCKLVRQHPPAHDNGLESYLSNSIKPTLAKIAELKSNARLPQLIKDLRHNERSNNCNS